MRISTTGFVAALIISAIITIILTVILQIFIGALAIGAVLLLPLSFAFSRKRTTAMDRTHRSIEPK